MVYNSRFRMIPSKKEELRYLYTNFHLELVEDCTQGMLIQLYFQPYVVWKKLLGTQIQAIGSFRRHMDGIKRA